MARKEPIRISANPATQRLHSPHAYRSQITPTFSVSKPAITKKINWRLKAILKKWYRWQANWQQPLSVTIVREPLSTLETPKAHKNKDQRPIFYLGFSLLLTFAISVGAWQSYLLIFRDLPAPEELATKDQNLTTIIRDRNGQVLYEIFEDENRTLVPLNQVPSYLINATIAIEDQHFHEHHGLDLLGILRAVRSNSQGGSTQGGSTITQQLVKLRLLNSEKTLQRKAREAVLAILVESNYSKEEILQMYLNQVAYGGYTYGIEAAAQRYFGKSARDLSLGESAYLAGLPAAPSIYNPFGSTPELAQARQAEVLRRMMEDNYITSEQAAIAQAENLAFIPEKVNIEAPHFVMYVKKMLAEKYGEQMLTTGGLEVTTTLDLALQESAQKDVTDEVKKLNRLNITNGAGLITNPQTGEVLAMIGSVDYFDTQHDGQVNVTVRERQPGSSIKPLTYALALERGYTPATLLDDTPVRFVTAGSEPYAPKNYDGQFHGQVPLRQSLAASYNIPAVRLLNAIGINTLIDRAQAIGFTTWQDRKRFGLALTLGGGEVKMTEIAQLYGSLANSGKTVTLNPILEIKSQQGEILYRNTCVLDQTGCQEKQNFDPRVAYQITNILSDNQARSSAFGLNSVLNIPKQQVAVKTGTTNNRRDNWTIGYTSDRVVAVWVGNNNNSEMSYVASGVTGASPIWNSLMRLTLDDAQPHAFVKPPGLVEVAMCGQSARGGCSSCSNARIEYFLPGTEPRGGCYAGRFSSSSGTTPNNVGNPPNRVPVPNQAQSERPAPRNQTTQTTIIRDQILDGAAITTETMTTEEYSL